MPSFWDLSRFVRQARADRDGCAVVQGRQIYILPTRYGFLFALLVGAMLIGSINSANNLGFMLTFLLVGLGLVAMLHTWHNLLGLRLIAGRAEPVFAGQEACFQVGLENRRGGPRPGIQLELTGGQVVATDLAADASDVLALCLRAPERGRQALGRFVLSTRFPLGLLRAWTFVDLDMHCLVYPRPGSQLEPPQAPDYSRSAEGDRGVGADDFVGLRQYRPGDIPRHIDWKAAARERGLLVKQFGGDRADQRWLDWDALPGLDVEARLSRLCRGVLTACDRQQEFGLRLPGVVIAPGRGQAHRHRCLAALALFGKEP